MIVSGLLLATAASTVVPALTWVAAQQRETALRQIALEEVSNLLEELTLRPWDDLAADSAEQPALAPEIADQLRDPELAVSVQRAEDDPNALRMRVELSWKSRAGQRLAPVRLTAWVFKEMGE